MELDQIKWTDVDSSNVSGVAHDPHENVLYVRFGRGAVYAYKNADNGVFTNMLNAQSVGKFLNDQIKPFHPYELISLTS